MEECVIMIHEVITQGTEHIIRGFASKTADRLITLFTNGPLALCSHSSTRGLATGKSRPQSKPAFEWLEQTVATCYLTCQKRMAETRRDLGFEYAVLFALPVALDPRQHTWDRHRCKNNIASKKLS